VKVTCCEARCSPFLFTSVLVCSTRFVRGCILKFPDWVITKYTLTTINARWEATRRVMTAKLTRLTHTIAIQLHLVAESFTICSSRSRRPVRKILDRPSYDCSVSYLTNWFLVAESEDSSLPLDTMLNQFHALHILITYSPEICVTGILPFPPRTDQAGVAVTEDTCIQKVPASNLSPDNCYPEWVIVVFPVSSGEFRDSIFKYVTSASF
jgi:hypothetical protein